LTGSTLKTGATEGSRAGRTLALWAALIVACQGLLWLSGVKSYALAEAVERGAAQVETRGVGEVGDDVIRKAIRTQHDTLPFWTALALLGDFACEPLTPAVRAASVAVLLSGLAALVGRPVQFGLAMAECASAQGYWVLGLAVRTALMLARGSAEIDTSLALALPPGAYPAELVVSLQQADAFALLGWIALARGGWRRGQANLLASALVCGAVALVEATVRISFALTLGAGMRLTLLPETR
jgi:hypothetical protein